MNEHQLQASIIAEVDLRARLQPEWARIFAVPNGGQRDVRVAKKLKAEGVRAGVPDLMWPMPRGRYHGMVMELKVGYNNPTASQRDWIRWLADQGWYVAVVYDDPAEAIEQFDWYYNGAEQP